jgi:hypothetical protein
MMKWTNSAVVARGYPPTKPVLLALLLSLTADRALAAEDWTESPNHLGVFVGATSGGSSSGDGRDYAAFTVGFDYERRLSQLWGVGLMADWSFGDRREYILAVPVFLHPGSNFRFHLAPGVERFRRGSPIQRAGWIVTNRWRPWVTMTRYRVAQGEGETAQRSRGWPGPCARAALSWMQRLKRVFAIDMPQGTLS